VQAGLTYVAIGASETFGAGTDDPATESWPANLATSLGKPVHLINLGIPGLHIHEALSSELPVALDAHPNLVTVWLATNDLADHVPLASYSRDLDLLLQRLQTAAPRARIAVANVPDLTLLPYFRSYDATTLRKQIADYNTAIATIVQRHHVVLVDIYDSWHELADHPEYVSRDGLHPDALGYTRIAQIFYDVLRKNGIS
jgi:lysophospholipase L1-like esterase